MTRSRTSSHRPAPRCVLDRNRPCTACVAASPAECPYPYLMAETS